MTTLPTPPPEEQDQQEGSKPSGSVFASKKLEHYCFLFNDLMVVTKKAGLATLMNFNVMRKKAKKKFNKNSQMLMEGTSTQQNETKGDTYEFERQMALTDNVSVEESLDFYMGTVAAYHLGPTHTTLTPKLIHTTNTAPSPHHITTPDSLLIQFTSNLQVRS